MTTSLGAFAPRLSFCEYVLIFFIAAALFSFVAAIPVFDFGYWKYSAAPRVAFYMAAAGLALTLAVSALRRPLAPPPSPLIVLGLFAALAPLIAGAGATSVSQNLFGPFVLGDGGAWWIAVAVLAYGAFVIAAAGASHILVGVAALAVLLELALNGAGGVLGVATRTHFLPDILGWSALCLVIALGAGRAGRAGRAVGARRFGVAILLLFVLAIVSENRSLAVVSAALFAYFLLNDKKYVKHSSLLVLGVVLITPALSVFASFFSSLFASSVTISDRFDYWGEIIDPASFSAMEFFFGHGFGQISDSIHVNATAEDVYKNNNPLLFDNKNIHLEALNTIHSHNIFIDIFHSVGFPLYATFACVFVILIQRAVSMGHPVAGYWACAALYGALWYLSAANAPVFALAIGLSVAALWRPDNASGSAAMRYGVITLAGLAAAALIYAAQHEVRFSGAMTTAHRSIADRAPDLEAIDAVMRLDASGDATSRLLLASVGGVVTTRDEAESPDTPLWRAIDRLWPELRRRADAADRPGRHAATDLIARGHLLTSPDAPAEIPGERAGWIREDWLARALAFTAHAPGRSDLLSPPLSDLFARGETAPLAAGAEAVLARRPDDPVGLWFLGLARLQADGDPASGFRLMARALDRGLARQFPVPDSLAAAVRAGAAQ